LDQRLLGKLSFAAGLGQQRTVYQTSGVNLQTGRNDSISSFNLGLNTSLFQRVKVGLTFQISRDASSTPGFGFSSRQLGFDVGYRY
jgi:hypothetical protein